MPFTVDDFHDLLRLLEARPEWRAELRRHVFTAELLELPELVRQLAAAQARTEQHLAALTTQVGQLAEAQVRTEQRMDQLAEQMAALTGEARVLRQDVDGLRADVAGLTTRVDGLATDMDGLKTDVRQLRTDVAGLKTDVGDLKGDALEQRYRIRAPAYFGRLVRRLRVVEHAALADLLDDAVDQGRLTEAERAAVLEADLVLAGRRRPDGAPVYLLVEASVGIGPRDVECAAARAAALAKLGRPVLPVVAAGGIGPEAEALAHQRGVWQVLDGRPVPPAAS